MLKFIEKCLFLLTNFVKIHTLNYNLMKHKMKEMKEQYLMLLFGTQK
jgi:hypothetical protein